MDQAGGLSQQPSGQSSMLSGVQPPANPGNGVAPAANAQPTLLGGGNEPGTASAGPVGLGHNGGPDWRAMLAGDDTKAVEQLSRFKSPGDFLKSHNELRTKLSERAAPARLAENATLEQVAEYRRGLGLPEIGGEATPDVYMAAYKVAPPAGYEPTAAEKGLLGDFAKQAYAKGFEPGAVKGAVDFFFQQQAAQQQVLNTLAAEKRMDGQSALKSEWGRDYETNLATAKGYFHHITGGDATLMGEIANARMPSGGLWGDHPLFVKMMTDLAIQNGMGDRIEANAMEANGKSLEQQQLELEKLQFTNRAEYNMKLPQLKKIVAHRMSRGEIDEMGEKVSARRR